MPRSDRSRKPTERTHGHPSGLAQTVESELLPRLALAHRMQGDAHSAPADGPRPFIGPNEVDQFVTRVLDARESLPGEQIASLMSRGATVESIYCDLLAPAARRLGEMWEDDSCDFLQVTVALGRLQQTLRDLSESTGRSPVRSETTRSVLITGLPDEQHTLGLLIVAECFVRDGWTVNVGHPLIENSLVETVREDWYDVVGFSLALPERVMELRGMITRLRRASRNPHLVVLVGGKAFLDDHDLVATVGADDGIGDARDAARVARVALAERGIAMTGEAREA